MPPKKRPTRARLSKGRNAKKVEKELADQVFTSFCEGHNLESIIEEENGDGARDSLNAPVSLEQLQEEHPLYSWAEDRAFVYDTVVGAAVRRLYMDSRLLRRSLYALRSAWAAKSQGVANDTHANPVLPWEDNGALRRKHLKDFILTVDGRALYQAALAGDIAATDVLSIALEWANTLVKPYTWEEADAETLASNQPAIGANNGGNAEDLGSQQQDPPPKGAVKRVASDQSAMGAMAAWRKVRKYGRSNNSVTGTKEIIMVADGEAPDTPTELPPLIPLPRHIGGQSFGVNRNPGIVNPWVDQQQAKKKNIDWVVEHDFSDAAVAEVEAALAEDDRLVKRVVYHGADNSWHYQVHDEYLVDELASEISFEAGKAAYFKRDGTLPGLVL